MVDFREKLQLIRKLKMVAETTIELPSQDSALGVLKRAVWMEESSYSRCRDSPSRRQEALVEIGLLTSQQWVVLGCIEE